MGHFGTDGIRCKDAIFTEEYLTRIAMGIASTGCKKVIFGRDPRVSGERMEKTMTEALTSCGVEVLSAGMVPTPVLAFLTSRYGCDCGIMLSASHNPPEYNGVKLFSPDGSKVSAETEKAVEEFIDSGRVLPRGKAHAAKAVDGADEYIDYLLKTLKPDLSGKKIALDTANGATSIVAPRVFERAGAEVTAFNTETDGLRINENCGATVPKTLLSIMQSGEYDIGFTYDGDGDRVMCVEKGKIFNGDHIMYVHCKDMLEKGALAGGVMVGTVMSNLGTEKACAAAGIKLVRTGVGDKYVYREMKKNGYNVGGEESGHIIFSDYMPTGDGILSSLLTAVLDRDKPIFERDDIEECPSAGDCIICGKEEVDRFKNSKEIEEYLKGIPAEYRTVIRPSGTEPKIRILVEAADSGMAQKKCAEIKGYLEEKIR